MTKDGGEGKDRVRFALPALGFVWLLLAGLIIITQLGTAPKIEITWATETEFDTAGFNVWRSVSQDGEYYKVNEQLIAGASDATAGADYRYVDEQVARGKTYYYRVEDVAFDGSSVLHETVSASAQEISRTVLGMVFACALIGVILILGGIIGRTKKENG